MLIQRSQWAGKCRIWPQTEDEGVASRVRRPSADKDVRPILIMLASGCPKLRTTDRFQTAPD